MKARLASAVAIALALASAPALAQKKYDPGASDSEIKIGNTNPYSGPASAYGVIGKTISAYFKMVNENGGINKRKVNFVTYDDGYSPPRTVEMWRASSWSRTRCCSCSRLSARRPTRRSTST
jgi:branched-chain amino acid transport system substrate-binding protein